MSAKEAQEERLGSVLLVSCYELGHQPAGIAMPAGLLRQTGRCAEAMDVSVEGFDSEKVGRASFIGISVPMHTALRLGVRVAREARRINPTAHVCFYGLYASLNAGYLLETVADSVIGGEFESALVALIAALDSGESLDVEGVATKRKQALPVLDRLPFAVPDRSALSPLDRYAKLEHQGEQRLVGYVEASRGCLHHCTHCPIPPVYDGRFFVIPVEVVLSDVRCLVEAGARHITFGDPDFLNGPGHSLRIARAIHQEFPSLTFDFTAKIEHLLKHRTLVADFARLGCVFIVSAVESLSDTVLTRLEKGHSRADVAEALQVLSAAGIAMRPSFVSFTPWTTMDDYIDVMDFVEAEGLIDHVDPVQFTIRLLVPPGSELLSRPDTKNWLGRLVQETFTYEWDHPDPRMDELHRRVAELVERAVAKNEDPAAIFYQIRDLACAARGEQSRASAGVVSPLRLRPPRLTEAWFC